MVKPASACPPVGDLAMVRSYRELVRRVRVAKIVQTDRRQTGSAHGSPPSLRDRVRSKRVTGR
jgi:hypothetical protein